MDITTPLIYVAGHQGMVGSSIVRQLISNGYSSSRLITKTHSELDLTDQQSVEMFFRKSSIDQVYLAAAKVGGIYANNAYPADFIYQNLMIQSNVINSAFRNGVKKLLFLGSSCIYPKMAAQPIKENALLTGHLEPTNEPYAIAKIAGIKLCESYNRQYGASHGVNYRSVMPTNLYGPGDNYHPDNSHVIPGLIRRFHEAKLKKITTVTIWGSGAPKREFLHVDDMASACIHVMNLSYERYAGSTEPMNSHINVGFGEDISISKLACLVAEVVNYEGSIAYDSNKPDGTPRKLMDSTRLRKLGWKPEIELKVGLEVTYQDFLRKFQ